MTFGIKLQERLKKECPEIEILRDEYGEPTYYFCCRKCGYEWHEQVPSNMLMRKIACPACKKEQQIEDLLEKIRKFHPDSDLELVGEYKGYHTPVLFHCNKCGGDFIRKPRMIFEKNNACLCCGYKDKKLQRVKERLSKHKYITMLNEEEYINEEIAMLFRCDLCGREWRETPFTVIKRKYPCGCKYEKELKRTHVYKSYDERFQEKHPSVYRVVKKGLEEESVFYCEDCGTEWRETTKLVLQRKHACLVCHPLKKQVKTHEDFVAKMQEIHPELEIISEYQGKHKEIIIKCPEGHIEHTTPKKLYDRSAGCMECKRIADQKEAWTTEKYVKIMEEKHPEVEIIGELTSMKQPIEYKIKKCGHTQAARAYDLMKKDIINCHACTPFVPYEKVLKRLHDKHPELEIVGSYNGLNNEACLKCHRCGYSWKETVSYVLSRAGGCPVCTASRAGTSFVEQFIYLFFVDILGKDKVFNRQRRYGVELDISIPCLQIAFEPGSWHWHAPKYEDDLKKKEICAQHSITLITIYDSYNACHGELPSELPDSFITYDHYLGERDCDELKQLVAKLYNIALGRLLDIDKYDKWEDIRKQAYIGNKRIIDEPWW